MSTDTTPKTRVKWPKERLSNFTDSVFAFAITLLVLNVMQTYLPSKTDALFPDLLKHISIFATYMITFVIVSRFWISHTRLFALIREYDRTIIDLNIFLLFFITLFPFVAMTISNHIGSRDAIIMYSACFVAIGLLEYFIGRHAYLSNLLINEENATPHSLRVFTLYSLTTPTLFLASIFIALVSPLAAEMVWVLLLFVHQAFRFFFRNNSTAEAEVERL